MSKRLQVLLDESELNEVQRIARSHRMSTAEWVRQSLRHAMLAENGVDDATKLAVIARGAEHRFPVADIDQMLREIEAGYLDDGSGRGGA